MYSPFTKVFRLVLDKHARPKVKKVRRTQGSFMTKELSKAVMNKSKIRNRSKYQKWLSWVNLLTLKTKKLCNKLTKSVKKAYFRKMAREGFANKAFWNTVKPFFILTKVFLQMKPLLQKTK